MKFLLLLYGDPRAEAKLSSQERRAIVERHIEWSRLLRDEGVLVSSEALGPESAAVVVRRGGRVGRQRDVTSRRPGEVRRRADGRP